MMEKNSIFLILLGAIITVIVTAMLSIIPFFITPQFAVVEYEHWNRTGCTSMENWAYNETCPEEGNFIRIDIEKIKLKNTGFVQAKNAILVLDSYGEGQLTQIECPEGIILDKEVNNIQKIEFPRFSTNLSCQFDFETLPNSRIKSITVTADDTPGYYWKADELFYQQIFSLTAFAVFLIVFLIGSLAYVVYEAYKLVRELFLQKRLSIPRKIRSVSCDLRFETPISTTSDDAEKESIKARDDWIKKVQQLSKSPITRKQTNENYDDITLNVQNQVANIVIQKKTTPQSRGTQFIAADLRITTQKVKTLQKLLDMGNHPCWTFFWYLPHEFNVENFVNKVRISSGITPSSSASMSTKEIANVITDATYHLFEIENGTIRTTFSRGGNKEGGKIGIIHDGDANMGFYRIRSILNPRVIMHMTYGAISIEKSLKIILKSCQKDNSWYQRLKSKFS